MQILKNKIFFILFLLCLSVGSLFAREVTLWTGYAGGKEIKNAWITGVDLLGYDINKNITLGARVYTLVADRKQYEMVIVSTTLFCLAACIILI
ncbi:hypothetical protein [Candidatus Endomicrobiellum devescovinae]|jgi:hypothetical protein|uniref:hypothetical protein n=1 Tax=Candidatus Endomicrobiellum devescovinae TaxID=3242322 RepID=UPI00283801FF|nr:hypothetical protein [Endomicrobium sp.]